MGEDPQDIGRLWQRLWKMNRQASIKAIGALDVYLWDINGKIAGLPIHRLLGTCKHAVPAYSSTAYHETAAAADAEEAMRFKEAGWRAHKLHPHGEPHADIDICRTVREAVGDGSTLMLDSMWAYQYADALRVGRAIEELDYYLRGDVAVTGGITPLVRQCHLAEGSACAANSITAATA